MNYILFIFFGLLVVIFQTMIANLLFFGKLIVELSLIIVVYAGFHQTLVKGGILSLLLGFFLDCFMGSVSGLFALSYVIFFLLAKFLSLRIYAERASFIMIIVGLCVFVEGIMTIAFYQLVYGVDKFQHLWRVFIPQALLVALCGPLFFRLLGKIEVMPDGGNSRSIERSAID